MKRIALVAGALLLLPLLGSALPPLEELLPEDTALCVLVEDLPGLRVKWEQGALKALWQDPRLREFTTPLLRDVEDDWDEDEDEGDWDEDWAGLGGILGLGTGRMVLAVPRSFQDWNDEPPGVLLLAVPEDDATRSRLRELFEDPDLRFGTREYRGVELRVGLDDGDRESEAWALLDGVAIFAETYDVLKNILDAVKDQRSPDFSDTRVYHRAMQGADVAVMVNLRSLLAGMQAELLEEIEEEQPFASGASVWNALGLDAWDGFYAVFDLDPEEVTVQTGVIFEDAVGLARLWPEGSGHLARPGFFPPGAVMYSAGMFTLRDWWTALLDMVNTVDSLAGPALKIQVSQLAAAYGFDFETDLLDALGDAWYSAGYPGEFRDDAPYPGLEQLIAVPVGNRDGLEAVLGALHRGDLGETLAWETSRVHGVTVYSSGVGDPFTTTAGPTRFAYALTGGYLLLSLSGTARIDQALGLMETPGPSLWDDPGIAAAVGALDHDASWLNYVDVPGMLDHTAAAMLHFRDDPATPNPGPALEAVRERLGSFTSWGITLRIVPAEGDPAYRECVSRSRLVLRP